MRTRRLWLAALAAAFIAPPPTGLLLITSAYAQVEGCGYSGSEVPFYQRGGGGAGCNQSSTEFYNNGGNPGWSTQVWHVPFPPGYSGAGYGSNDVAGYHHRPTATKQISISLHIWLRDEGDYNWLDTPLNRQRMAMMIDYISENYFESVAPPSDPGIPDLDYYLQDTRIQLKLADIVFRNSTWWWSANNIGCTDSQVMEACSNAALADRPDLKNTVLWHVVGPWSCGSSSGTACNPTPGSFFWDNPAWVVVHGSENPNFWGPTDWQWGAVAQQWAHEFMHAMDLTHVYDWSAPLNSGQFDFMPDVFSCYQQAPWCTVQNVASQCASGLPFINYCPMGGFNGCDATANEFDICTNNVMAPSVGQ